MPRKPLLLIGATHGDEPIGVRVLTRLAKDNDGFDWIIGNPPAYLRGMREFEGDLNRSAPGDPYSPRYAERRAAEILALADKYGACIDLHGTTAYTGVFLIVTRLAQENLRLAARLDVPRVVFWPSLTPDLTGPLSEHVSCGLEIECGPKGLPAVARRLETILAHHLQSRTDPMTDDEAILRLSERQLYEVTGAYHGSADGLEEFRLTTRDSKRFFPLMIGQYAAQGVTCYALKEARIIDWW